MKKKLRKPLIMPTVDNLYFITAILLIFAAIIFIGITKGKNFEQLFWHGETLGIYPDLFESVIQARTKDPYSLDAIYPAFAYCLLWPINMFIPGNKYKDSFDDLEAFCSNIETHVIAHIFYAAMTAAIAYVIIKLYGSKKDIKKYALVFIYIFSSPFIFMIERGNTVIITIIFLFVYFLFYNSEDKRLRELALICLACATAMKIYPVVFGLLLIADKRVKDAIHAVIYGALVFFVPFFFMGGIGKVPAMLQNAMGLNSNSVSGSTGFGYGFKVNATSSVASIFDWLFDATFSTQIKSVVYFVMALLLISSLVIKSEWKRAAALSLVVILMPDFSFIYNVSYLLIPLILFLKEHRGERLNAKNGFYTACFVGAFAPLPYGEFFRSIGGFNDMNWSTMISSISLIVLALVIAFDGVRTLLKENAKAITAVALAGSLAFGFVPVVLAKTSAKEPEIQRVEALWSITQEEQNTIDGFKAYVEDNLEGKNKVLCFPKVNSIINFDKVDNHIWYSMRDQSDSITNYTKFEKLNPQFIVVNMCGYNHFKTAIKNGDCKKSQYKQFKVMQLNLIDFLNKGNKYSVVKVLKLQNDTVVAVWEKNEYAGKDAGFWNDGGDGSQDNPYLISNYEQLKLFSYISNAGGEFNNTHIMLSNDIDATSEERFLPIARQSDLGFFGGIFNGNGHAIKNLNLKYEYDGENDAANNVAFVNYLNGTIQNLIIENAEIVGTCCAVFARVSASFNTAIINCISRGNTVKGKRAGEFADKYGAVIANCVGENNNLEAIKTAGFVSVKDTGVNIFNCFSTRYDELHYAAYIEPEMIKNGSLAKTLNNSTAEYKSYREESIAKALKKIKKAAKKYITNKYVVDYSEWTVNDGEISFVTE